MFEKWVKLNKDDKQNVIYTYNGILFRLKKVGNSNTCY